MGQTYLYGVIAGAKEAALGIAGVDGVSPAHVVARGDLGCVVSDYKGKDFGALSQERVVRSLLAHQQVVEQVMRDRTVLPVKFGTLLGSSQEVRAVLEQGQAQLGRALASIQDQIEIEVAATWDARRVLQDISNDDQVVRTREAILRSGQPSPEERIHLGQLVKGCMDRRRDSYRERMMEVLRPLAFDAAANTLVSDAMVMNVAFLVDRSRQREFDERIQRLDELFRDEITFRVIGPLPPYSFSRVEITPLTPEQVEEARQTLWLGDVISEARVRKAYRRLAAEEQRDLEAGDELAKVRFAILRRATALLLHFCRADGEAQAAGGGPGTAGRNRGRRFLIDVKGSRSDEIEPTRFGAADRAQPGW